jgi:hypothetical protein
LQDPPKFTQIRIFSLKICHLATLESGRNFDPNAAEGKFDGAAGNRGRFDEASDKRGQGDQIGRIWGVYFGHFLKIAEVAQILEPLFPWYKIHMY